MGDLGPEVAPRPEVGVVSRPALFELLDRAPRVTAITGSPGSGKTFLLRSWLRERSLGQRAASISVPRAERDLQHFWATLVDALRRTAPGAAVIRPLSASPSFDGSDAVERLLEDLSALEDRIWIIVDDLHELRSDEALRQFDLLVLRAPPTVRFVLAARHDVRLHLHRLRLEGEVIEIRGEDLRFTVEEARALVDAAGLQLPDSTLAMLVARTEGWVAGLRLAVLSLARHPDPEQFAIQFSGSDRTVADYLMAEVLELQPEEVRRLLVRTSILQTVNGPLADVLTGGSGSERILHDLEEANAFVLAVDPARSWFRYHHLFADLLQVELRRSATEDIPALHGAAADWYAENGFPVDAIRHAQAGARWVVAARLLSDHWFSLELDGRAGTAHDLLAGFPAGVVAADAELTALLAAAELHRGSLEEAERHLAIAEESSASVPAARRGRWEVMLAMLRVSLAGHRGDVSAVVTLGERLIDASEAGSGAPMELGADLRTLAIISLGMAALWTLRHEEAERRLAEGLGLAHRIRRPYLELTALAYLARVTALRSLPAAVQLGTEAIALAERHGWTQEPVAAVACMALASVASWQGQFDEGEHWLGRAAIAVRPELQPATALLLSHIRAALDVARGRYDDALRALAKAEELGQHLATQDLAIRARALRLETLVRVGEIESVERAMAELHDEDRDVAEMRIALSVLRVAQNDPQAAADALAPVLQGSAPIIHVGYGSALAAEAIARDALGDGAGAGRALERALDLAEPDGMLLPFLLHPNAELLERHRRSGTAHGALVSEILALLPGGRGEAVPSSAERLLEPLTESEMRVLRYLPTGLSLIDIGNELYITSNTVKTHARHIYAKLGVHSRSEAVDRSRSLGLVAPRSSLAGHR